MKIKPAFTLLRAAALLLLLSTINYQLTALAQGTAFTYQGRLNDGAGPAHGAYDLTFALYDSVTGGAQQGDTFTNIATAVSNGLFTVMLDFGNQFPGADRWLEIGVRTNGLGAFATLSPRQPITPTPYSIAAETASNLTGSISSENLAGSYTNALTLNNGLNEFYGTFSGTFYGPLFVGGSFSGAHFGDGSGLYNLNASQLATGTVPDARLAGNIARTNQVWLLNGNSGTTPGPNFLGTTDNQPLELHANNQRVFQLVPDSSTNDAPDIIGGSPVNFIAPGIVGATIAGGGAPVFNGVPGTNRILGDFNAIGGGWDNVTGGTNFNVTEATIAGGAHNVASGITSFIGGGANNLAYGNNATVAGGLQDRADYHSFVGSGYGNAADGANNVIGGGYQNSTDTNSFDAVIGGGYQNSIMSSADVAFIGGGYNNSNQSYAGIIGGGGYNMIQSNANWSTIPGGFGNLIQTNASESAIGGGLYNNIWGDASQSVIAGGYNNNIEYYSSESFIGGGAGNAIASSSPQGFIGGGSGNLIQFDADHSTIGGGGGNQVLFNGRVSTIGGGLYNQVGAYSTVPGGYSNAAIGNFSLAAGSFAQATNDGSFALADDEPFYFYSTTSNQLSARFTGGVRFVTGGAGITVDGQPLVSGNYSSPVTLTNGGDSFAGTFAGNGAGLTNVAPASGSTNYIQNQSSTLQPASFAIAGNAQVAGLFRSGSETGTAEAPSPAGLVIRRINSTTPASNSVVAVSRTLNSVANITLVRDGTSAGWQIQIPASPGSITIAAMGIDNTGTSRNFYTTVTTGPTTIQLYNNSQNIVHFECTFGDTFDTGPQQLTQVVLSRYASDFYWSGNVISTYNQ